MYRSYPLSLSTATRMSTNQSWAPLSLLNRPIPRPPVYFSPLTPTPRQSQIRFTAKDLGITSECLRVLRYDLLRRRRTIISEPQTPNTDRTFDGYVESYVIGPVVSLLNVLRRTPQYPTLRYHLKANPHESPLAAEVRYSGDFSTSNSKFPIIIFTPPFSFQHDVETQSFSLPLFPSLGRALSSLRQSSQGNRIIVTDLSTTVLINNVDEKLTTAVCEITPSTSAVSLRYLLASYIRDTLPRDHLDLDTTDFIIPQGAPNDPALPLASDHQIFTTRHSHSDFDRYSLVNCRSAVDQFFRWKALMHAKAIPAMVGTVLQAECHGFMQKCGPIQPRYPIEPLPESTRAHLLAVARRSFPQFSRLLNCSRTFSLLLEEELTPSEGTAYARTFSCRLTMVDGQLSPDDMPKKLCVKLFDDRAALVPNIAEYLSLAWWLQDFRTAEEMIKNEINAYTRLEDAWGTVVPYFYGAHRFKLQDGRHLFGILMEYVEKSDRKLEEQPEVVQIAFIESARHAVRVLQYADISQLDWSSEQWICAPSPSSTNSSPALTCVLIDFSLTSQGDCYNDGHKEDDYGEVADMMYESGIPPDLIKKWYGPREEWDFFLTSSIMDSTRC